MTREEAINYLMDISYQLGTTSIEYLSEKDGKKMREAIKALEQEPCTDAISREETLKALEKSQYSLEFCQDKGIDYSVNMSMVRIVLRDMPPITPAEKVGKWIVYNKGIYECSCCSRRIKVPYNLENIIQDYPYCNCGAKMQEVEDANSD